MEPNLAVSIYVRFSIRFLHFIPFHQQIWPPILIFFSDCSNMFLFFHHFLYFLVLGLRFLYFPILQYNNEKKRMDNENSESCGLSSWYWLFVSVMGKYEKQQSVNLMYISMERMCIHVSLVFLMFSIFEVIHKQPNLYHWTDNMQQ